MGFRDGLVVPSFTLYMGTVRKVPCQDSALTLSDSRVGHVILAVGTKSLGSCLIALSTLGYQQSLQLFPEYAHVTHHISAPGMRDPMKIALAVVAGLGGNIETSRSPIPLPRIFCLSRSILHMFKMDHLILPINCFYKVQGWELKAVDSELGSALSHEVNFSNFTFIFL